MNRENIAALNNEDLLEHEDLIGAELEELNETWVMHDRLLPKCVIALISERVKELEAIQVPIFDEMGKRNLKPLNPIPD